jgi:hypothetical protein
MRPVSPSTAQREVVLTGDRPRRPLYLGHIAGSLRTRLALQYEHDQTILIRLGRLDVFPANDTSVARNLALVGGSASQDVAAVLEALGPEQGMLYHHLLLARLDARAGLGHVAASAHQSTRHFGA